MKKMVFFAIVAVLGISCAREEKPLDVHAVLGRSPEDLIERWGEPKQYKKDPGVGEKYGFALWPDIAGVRVFIAVKRGQVTWVTYRFEHMEPFDEAEAFRIINVEPPADEPVHKPGEEGTKRWKPFGKYGKYGKMTVSPAIKFVGVGWDIRLPMEKTMAALEESGLGAPSR